MSPQSADTLISAFPPAGERVATTSDLDVLKQLLHHKIDSEIAGVRTEIAGVRAEMKDNFRRAYLANTGTMFTLAGLALAATKLL